MSPAHPGHFTERLELLMMQSQGRVVVIGAGGNGASLAFHLGALARHVTLLDRREPGSQTSPRAAGIGMVAHSNDATGQLGRISLGMLERFEELTGERLMLWRSGSLKIARSDELGAKVGEEVDALRADGFDAALVSPEEATERAPYLDDLSAASAISWTPHDVQFEPSDLPNAYLRACERVGVDVRGNTEVVAIVRRPDGAYDVETNAETIVADQIAIAAGGWTPRLASMLGAFIPVVPVRHQLGVTNAVPGVSLRQPTVRIIDNNAYLRPYDDGLIFGAYEPDPLFIDVEQAPAAYDISDVPGDLDRLLVSAGEVRDMVPAVVGAGFREVRPGIPTLTSDGKYVIDQLPDAPGVWVISGCCVTGLHTAPATGHLVAKWMSDPDQQRPDKLAPFSLARFNADLRNRPALLAAAREAYEHKYQNFEEGTQ
jgi:glycine/D-amino acid oxidase-like deaminating enzyme